MACDLNFGAAFPTSVAMISSLSVLKSIESNRSIGNAFHSVSFQIRLERLGPADQVQELLPRLGIAAEPALHGAGDHMSVVLLHAAHHDAQMQGLDDDPDSLGPERR